jgi:hypothetical protein
MKEYTLVDCENLFQTLFPNGFANPDVMHSAAPDGWENSPFVLPVPTLEEAYETAKAHKSLENLMARINSEPQTDDPNNAMAQELKQQEEQKAKDDFKSKIEDMNAQARENALYKPPPQVVQAYQAVFGEFPKGWPPL